MKETEMSALCYFKLNFLSLIISDLILLSSFILSHPLYLSYFIFFSPYLLKLVHFLSPLFVTTSLLSLAFLTGFVNEGFVVEMLRFERVHQSGEFRSLDDLGMYEILFGSDVMEERENPVEFSEGKPGEDSLNKIEDLADDEVKMLDDFGMYEILFESPVMEERENPVESSEEKLEEDSLRCSNKFEDLADKEVKINQISGDKSQNSSPKMEEKRLENFLKILDEFERMSSNVDEKKPSRGAKADKAVEKTKAKADELLSNGSEAARDKANEAAINGGKEHAPAAKAQSRRITSTIEELEGDRNTKDAAINGGKEHTPAVKAESQKIISTIEELEGDSNTKGTAINGGKEHTPAVKAQSQRITPKIEELEGARNARSKGESSRALMAVNSYGSMRKEKEWKRTLACKLFEERHNVDGGEGMDSLWEAYETDSIKNNPEKKTRKKNKHSSQKKKEIEEDDEEDEIEGQLCCLQALKLSSGKMNMGMGRPNLVKITKAIKGFGWLHHVSKHSKKVHNNNGDRY